MGETVMDALRRIWDEGAARKQEANERRAMIREMARVVLAADGLAVMDTETTGLGSRDEVIEIGIVAGCGATILHSLVRPTLPIPADATAIHGIGNEDVAGAPTMEEIGPLAVKVMEGRFVATYNGGFDFRLLRQSFDSVGVSPSLRGKSRPWDEAQGEGVIVVDTACVMRMYAAWHGEWSDYHRGYAYQKLTKAVADCGLSFEGEAHGALADAKATLAILRHMTTALP